MGFFWEIMEMSLAGAPHIWYRSLRVPTGENPYRSGKIIHKKKYYLPYEVLECKHLSVVPKKTPRFSSLESNTNSPFKFYHINLSCLCLIHNVTVMILSFRTDRSGQTV